MTLAVYTVLMLVAGICITGTAKGTGMINVFVWVGIVVGMLAVSVVLAVAVRRASMWMGEYFK